MKLLFASDSFKGSLSSAQTAELLARAAREVFGNCVTEGVPMADGGEGTVDAVLAATNGERVFARVHDPLMGKVEAAYGVIDGKRAVIEMAAASGLPLVPLERRDPRRTTTFGTGELIRDVLDRGLRDITVAIGGSATNDGGMGCARALGVRFLDEAGGELAGLGEDLRRVARIDVSGTDERLRDAKLTVMCDVTNPLCGETGATYTFGAQKGATPAIQEELEAGMRNYRSVILHTFGVDCDTIRGAGAAGGLGAALRVFFGGEMKSGVETVLDLIGFDERLAAVDLVVTGEGRTDRQSCFGKVVQGVGERAKRRGVPALALCGSLGEGWEEILSHGIDSVMTTVDGPMPLEEAMERAGELYYRGAVRMFRMVRAGMELQR